MDAIQNDLDDLNRIMVKNIGNWTITYPFTNSVVLNSFIHVGDELKTIIIP